MTKSPIRSTLATAVSILAFGNMSVQAGEAPTAFQPVLDTFLSNAVADCNDMDGGEFQLFGGASMVADFNGDGITDPMVDGRMMQCSTSATLFGGGSGGDYLNVFVSGNGGYQRFEFLALDFTVLAQPAGAVLVLQQHGSACDLTGADLCFGAYSWTDGAFHSAGATVKVAE